MKDKLMLYVSSLRNSGQCQGIIDADRFFCPQRNSPQAFPLKIKKRLTQQINDAVNNEVFPRTAILANLFAPNTRRKGAPPWHYLAARRPEAYQNNIYARTTTACPR